MIRSWLSAVSSALARGATAAACVSLVGMALVEGWQVFARYVLNHSPGWTEPVVLLLMSIVMMFGAAVAVRSESHFGFFIVVHAASQRGRVVLLTVARLVMLATGALLAYWGGVLMIDSWSVPMAGAPLPQGLVFLPICAGGVLIALFALERLGHPAATLEPAAER